MLTMLTMLVISLAAAAPTAATTNVICDVGKAALRDLPPADKSGRSDTYYGGGDLRHRDLLDACPKLRSAIPADYPLADQNARSRASVHAPIPGVETRPAYIYVIGVPKVSADLKSAIVSIDYSCTGLCGGSLQARYVLTPSGWQRDGEPRVLYVS